MRRAYVWVHSLESAPPDGVLITSVMSLPTELRLDETTKFLVVREDIGNNLELVEPNIIKIKKDLPDSIASIYLIRFMLFITYTLGKQSQAISGILSEKDLDGIAAGMFQWLAMSNLTSMCDEDGCREWVSMSLNSKTRQP